MGLTRESKPHSKREKATGRRRRVTIWHSLFVCLGCGHKGGWREGKTHETWRPSLGQKCNPVAWEVPVTSGEGSSGLVEALAALRTDSVNNVECEHCTAYLGLTKEDDVRVSKKTVLRTRRLPDIVVVRLKRQVGFRKLITAPDTLCGEELGVAYDVDSTEEQEAEEIWRRRRRRRSRHREGRKRRSRSHGMVVLCQR